MFSSAYDILECAPSFRQSIMVSIRPIQVKSSNRANIYENGKASRFGGMNGAKVHSGAQPQMYKSSFNNPNRNFEGIEAHNRMHQTMIPEEVSYKKNANIDSIKGLMKREADQKIHLVSEKMEMEFIIQDQKEAQESLKKEFERLTRDKKNQIGKLDELNVQMEKQLEDNTAKRENLNQEVSPISEVGVPFHLSIFYIF